MALSMTLLFAFFPSAAFAAERYEILMIGDKDEYVLALQRKLKELGFFDAAPTGYFGNITQQAVADFQTVRGLKADGKAGPRTLGVLMGDRFALPKGRTVSGSERSDVLYPGDKGSAVADLQQSLKNLGYYSHEAATGFYGPVTVKAVRRFQRNNNLSADGIAGPETLTLLGSGRAKYFCIYPGDRGGDVTAMQQKLQKLGFFDGKVSGYFGTLTKAALMEFQAVCGLKVDARAGRDTLSRLYAKDAPSWDGIRRTAAANAEQKTAPVEKMLAFAQAQLGKNYVYGTAGPASFDATGFVCYVLKYMGVSTTCHSAAGFSRVDNWSKITSLAALLPGDLLFFAVDGSRINHTAIFLGNGRMIHAHTGGVAVCALDDAYNEYFSFARRIF